MSAITARGPPAHPHVVRWTSTSGDFRRLPGPSGGGWRLVGATLVLFPHPLRIKEIHHARFVHQQRRRRVR